MQHEKTGTIKLAFYILLILLGIYLLIQTPYG